MSERRKDVIDYLRTYDLPSLLREAGYDVREGFADLFSNLVIEWDDSHVKPPEMKDRKPNRLVVMLPDEDEEA